MVVLNIARRESAWAGQVARRSGEARFKDRNLEAVSVLAGHAAREKS